MVRLRIPPSRPAGETAAGDACSWGPHPEGCGPQLQNVRQRQAGTMFSAVGPFWPCAMSKVTF